MFLFKMDIFSIKRIKNKFMLYYTKKPSYKIRYKDNANKFLEILSG